MRLQRRPRELAHRTYCYRLCVCHFIVGHKITADILREVGIKPAHHTSADCRTKDQYHVMKGKYQSIGLIKTSLQMHTGTKQARTTGLALKKGRSYRRRDLYLSRAW